jgi:hypothetical protein
VDPIYKLLLNRDPIAGRDLASQPTLRERFANHWLVTGYAYDRYRASRSVLPSCHGQQKVELQDAIIAGVSSGRRPSSPRRAGPPFRSVPRRGLLSGRMSFTVSCVQVAPAAIIALEKSGVTQCINVNGVLPNLSFTFRSAPAWASSATARSFQQALKIGVRP